MKWSKEHKAFCREVVKQCTRREGVLAITNWKEAAAIVSQQVPGVTDVKSLKALNDAAIVQEGRDKKKVEAEVAQTMSLQRYKRKERDSISSIESLDSVSEDKMLAAEANILGITVNGIVDIHEKDKATMVKLGQKSLANSIEHIKRGAKRRKKEKALKALTETSKPEPKATKGNILPAEEEKLSSTGSRFVQAAAAGAATLGTVFVTAPIAGPAAAVAAAGVAAYTMCAAPKKKSTKAAPPKKQVRRTKTIGTGKAPPSTPPPVRGSVEAPKTVPSKRTQPTVRQPVGYVSHSEGHYEVLDDSKRNVLGIAVREDDGKLYPVDENGCFGEIPLSQEEEKFFKSKYPMEMAEIDNLRLMPTKTTRQIAVWNNALKSKQPDSWNLDEVD